MNTLRVVIADDQVLVRTGFRMILMSEGIDVVGEAANGDEALRVVRQTRPDVVLMDIRMPGMDGLEATRLILAEEAARAAARAGAGGGGAGARAWAWSRVRARLRQPVWPRVPPPMPPPTLPARTARASSS